MFDLFADFFEDSDLFEGVSSNPKGSADPVDLKDTPNAGNAAKSTSPVITVDGDGVKQAGTAPSAQLGSSWTAAGRPPPLPPPLITLNSPETPAEDRVTSSTIRGAKGTASDSPLFTVTRPKPETPTADGAAAGLAVTSPSVSPILSSQCCPRESVARRHSTPVSARPPRRLSRAAHRHSTPLAAPAPAPGSSVAFVDGDDPWAEAEFETPRRPAARALCMTNFTARKSSARVPQSPLARPPAATPNSDSPLVASASKRYPDKGGPAQVRCASNGDSVTSQANGTNNTLIRSSSTLKETTDFPVVLLSRLPSRVGGPSRAVLSRTADTDSPVTLPNSVSNDTDSPIARPAGGRRRPAVLRDDSDGGSPPPGWLAEGAQGPESPSHGESTGSPRPCRDSSSETAPRRGETDRRRRRRRRQRNPFLDEEADLSASGCVSSDEDSGGPDSDAYDESMIDDAPNPTQGDVDMRAIYLKSVRSPARAAPGFRRQARPRPTDSVLFSQVPHQDDDYEQDSFCVGSDHVEYASSASSHSGSPANRRRARRRRIIALSSSDEHSPAPKARRDASAAVRSDTSATFRPRSGSESDGDFQPGRSEASSRSAVRERTATKSSEEKNKKKSSPVGGQWLSSKRPAVSLPKPNVKAKRHSGLDDPFENSEAGTGKKAQRKRTPPSRAPPVFDLGLFDSDDEAPTVAPLSERNANSATDLAERERQARLERARLKQAEFRRRRTGGGQSMPVAMEVAVGGAGTVDSGRPTQAGFQNRLSAAAPVPGVGSRPMDAGQTSSQRPGPLLLLASSREVSCAPQVLSDLRAVHRLSTVVRALPAEDYVISRRAAVVRRPAADLQTAVGRQKLTARLRRVVRLYRSCWLIVERDRVKPGAAASSASAASSDRRCRAADTLLARLARAGVSILHSDSAAQSASLLARLAATERQAGWGLPPPPPEAPPSPAEDARRRLLESLPGVSAPLAAEIRSEFGTLAQFLQSSPAELERRLGGVLSRGRTVELCQTLHWNFSLT